MENRKTKMIKVDKRRTEEYHKVIHEVGAILQEGGLVAFPTETVYGLGADAMNEEAAKQTYQAKGRPSDNPLIVHIAEMGALSRLTTEISEVAEQVAQKFWPGPLTLVFHKSDVVPYGTTGGLETVAVRMPDHEIARDIILAGGGYVSAPSANSSGRPSPTLAEHVYEDLSGKIDAIVDGGEVQFGVESTIVDVTVDPPMILRPGAITKQMLAEVVGEVQVDSSLMSADSLEAPKAPGMKYRHYAPKAKMVIVEGELEAMVEAMNQLAVERRNQGKKVAVLATKEHESLYQADVVKVIGSRRDEYEIARNLYRILREFDEESVDEIISEAFDARGIGYATMNRLKKAASNQILDAREVIRNIKDGC